MRALLNQCRATVLAMDAVRRVNPAAKLISTEDVGKTYATPKLQYQADFDNDRRWWSYDILCGRFN
jgi:dTDP-4-dehydrorhamnose reductase